MKTWQLIAILGGVAIVGILLMQTKAKASGAKTAPSAPGNLFNGAGLAGLIGATSGLVNAIKGSGSSYPNQGTYQTGIVPVVTGNTLTDPNTGSTLVYGTD